MVNGNQVDLTIPQQSTVVDSGIRGKGKQRADGVADGQVKKKKKAVKARSEILDEDDSASVFANPKKRKTKVKHETVETQEPFIKAEQQDDDFN